jgi:hypothetical protein
MKEAGSFKEEKDARLGESLSGKSVSKLQRFGIYAVILFVTFLLGFIPAWLMKRTAAMERDAVVRQLRTSQLQNHLGNSIVNARIGEYEPARIAASSFFTDLQTEIDRQENAAFSSEQNQTLQPIFDQRDEIITLLARSDPASVERLTNLYIAYMRVVNLAPSSQ